MRTYTIEYKGKLVFSVQALSIRLAIVIAVDLIGAGISDKNIYSEDYASIDIFKNGKTSKISVCAEQPATLSIHSICEELLA